LISHVAGVLASVTLAVPAVAPAPAPLAAPASVTWTVQPATENGPDGRRWMEHTLDPGQVITEHLAVRNFGDTAATFSLKAADGYLTDKGRFNMLPSDQKSVDGGTWITVQESVSVPARGSEVVPFTISVPSDATPGDHPAGIAAAVAGKQGTVQVESRVGFRVLLRASGTLTPALTATGVKTRYEPSWNPLRPGALHVGFVASNTGNMRLDAQSRISTGFGGSSTVPLGELLPGGTREITTRVDGVWGLGPVRATLRFTPAENMPEVSVTQWVVPWPQLALVTALVALGGLLRALRRHRRRRLQTLLAQARLEGARSVS
jgi:hypothetical protein